MKVSLQRLSGEKLSVDVAADATLADLKRAVARAESLRAGTFHLFHDEDSLQVHDDRMGLSYYGITEDAALTLVRRPLECFTSAQDGAIKIWDGTAGVCKHTLCTVPFNVISAHFSVDRSLVLTACASRVSTARVWNIATGECERVFRHPSRVVAATFSDDASIVLTLSRGSADNLKVAMLWEMASSECRSTLSDSVSSAVFSANGALVAAASGMRDEVKVFDVASGACRHTLSGYHGHGARMICAVFSQDSSNLLTSCDVGEEAIIWDVESGRRTQVLSGHPGRVLHGSFSADSSLVLTASSDQTAKLWNRGTGECTQKFSGHGAGVTRAEFALGGQLVLTVSIDHTAKIWDAMTGDCKHTLAHTRTCDGTNFVHSDLFAAVFSEDCTVVMTSSSDKTAKIWDVPSGECIQTLCGHTAPVTVAFFA